MWAHVLTGPYTFAQVDVPAPDPANLQEGQVLLATRAGGICGSDLPNFKGSPPPPVRPGQKEPFPGFPLHEVVGEIRASRHPAHAPGDQVAGWASGFDGLAELVVSDGDGLAPYDQTLPPAVAVMLQPLACVLYAAEQLGDLRGRSAAVIGQGPIGLLFSHVLKDRGARHVTGVDRVDRSEAAGLFGVDETATASANAWAAQRFTSGRPEVVVEAVGHQVTTLKNALDAVAHGGQVFYFGIPDDLVYPFDMMTFLRKNLTLRSGATMERPRMLAEAVAYLARHPELATSYVSDVYPVAQVEKAFQAAVWPTVGQYKVALDHS